MTRSSTRRNFFLKYSKINKQNMSVSRSGVSIWNRLSSKFHEMPKTKFKCNNHNMLLPKLLEANEYIDLSDLNMPRLPNLFHLHYPFSFSCNLFQFLWILFHLVFFFSQIPYWSIFNYYYMTRVCSWYSPCSDWLNVTEL